MKKCFSVAKLSSLLLMLLLCSCGGGDDIAGGGLALDTVIVTAQASSGRLESDVVTGNTCSAGNSTGGTLSSDYVDVTVRSSTYPGLSGVTTSPVNIDSYTVTFTPINPTIPALPPQSFTLIGTSVNPNGSITVPVGVAVESLKLTLIDEKNLLPCSSSIYEYYAVITFSVVETLTGRRGSLISSLNVAFADRN